MRILPGDHSCQAMVLLFNLCGCRYPLFPGLRPSKEEFSELCINLLLPGKLPALSTVILVEEYVEGSSYEGEQKEDHDPGKGAGGIPSFDKKNGKYKNDVQNQRSGR